MIYRESPGTTNHLLISVNNVQVSECQNFNTGGLTVNNAEITSQETVENANCLFKMLLAHESASVHRRYHFLQGKKGLSHKPSKINRELASLWSFQRSTSGLSGEVCVLGALSALFSRSVMLVSFTAELALLQEWNTKMESRATVAITLAVYCISHPY